MKMTVYCIASVFTFCVKSAGQKFSDSLDGGIPQRTQTAGFRGKAQFTCWVQVTMGEVIFNNYWEELFHQLNLQADAFDQAFAKWKPWQLVLGTAVAVWLSHALLQLLLVSWTLMWNLQGKSATECMD
jgi:hypothetical protein